MAKAKSKKKVVPKPKTHNAQIRIKGVVVDEFSISGSFMRKLIRNDEKKEKEFKEFIAENERRLKKL